MPEHRYGPVAEEAVRIQHVLNSYYGTVPEQEFAEFKERNLNALNKLSRGTIHGATVYCSGDLITSHTDVIADQPHVQPNMILRSMGITNTSCRGEISDFISLDLFSEIAAENQQEQETLIRIRQRSGRIAVANTIIVSKNIIQSHSGLSLEMFMNKVAAPVSTSYLFYPSSQEYENKLLSDAVSEYIGGCSRSDRNRFEDICVALYGPGDTIVSLVNSSSSFNRLCENKSTLQKEMLLNYFRMLIRPAITDKVVKFTNLPPILRLYKDGEPAIVFVDNTKLVMEVEDVGFFQKYGRQHKKGYPVLSGSALGLHLTGKLVNSREYAGTDIAVPLANLKNTVVDSLS